MASKKLKQGLPTFLEGESELQVAEEKSSMNNKVEEFIEINDPVLSVDCKNKGRLGNYSNTEIMTGKIIA
ncbi:MAG: hypothetical protein IJS54_02960 [Desulfovibrio sp.]|nr:hypothetical protein [Desulfovibrio sp.]